jgi:hypothetical protein
MNQGKFGSGMTTTNLRLNPPQPVDVPPESKPRSRHAVITHELYSYRRYKTWMNNLRASWHKV